MKRYLAIFILLIFFFSQFGKVINYSLCTIATYQHTNTFHCDCEKQLTYATDAESKKQSPVHAAHLQTADELYHLHNSTAFHVAYFIPAVNYISGGAESLYNRYSNSIFHPPGRM